MTAYYNLAKKIEEAINNRSENIAILWTIEGVLSRELKEKLDDMDKEVAGGCDCYDWKTEVKINNTFVWLQGAWAFKNGSSNGEFRQIYYCPMCGQKLRKPA